ncbi:MAG: deoxyribodipyrimidine photo-lyase [Saprospiraceae bacterium]
MAASVVSTPVISIFWFRRDLRIEDNHGLYEALLHSAPVLCIFIFDKNILEGLTNKLDQRVEFIHSTLLDIDKELSSYGSSLLTFHDTPENAFNTCIEKFNIQTVFTNHDYEPYAISRDEKVRDLLNEKGIPLLTFKDQVIFEKNEITKSDHSPYTIFTPYSKKWKEKYFNTPVQNYAVQEKLDNLFKIKNPRIPSLLELGFHASGRNSPSPQPDIEIIKHYHETRNLPFLRGTSRLSVHLRFGTVSIRQIVELAHRFNEQWLNELIWREFFMMILFHFPRVVTESFKKKYDGIPWRNNEVEFKAWCLGETGYPLVDAGMRELNETGFMHNRVRMVIASFLTKHLLIDWRWGEAYFADKLLDYELSSNNGNWQWAAGCGCDAAPYFRIFNPYEQAKKFDPDAKYIKNWIKNFKPGYIDPIVDHEFARKRALEVYKKAVSEVK